MPSPTLGYRQAVFQVYVGEVRIIVFIHNVLQLFKTICIAAGAASVLWMAECRDVRGRQLPQIVTVVLKAASSLCSWHLQVQLVASIFQQCEEPRERLGHGMHTFNMQFAARHLPICTGVFLPFPVECEKRLANDIIDSLSILILAPASNNLQWSSNNLQWSSSGDARVRSGRAHMYTSYVPGKLQLVAPNCAPETTVPSYIIIRSA